MLRSECYLKQLSKLLSGSQSSCLRGNASLLQSPSCQKCQARRFHVSSDWQTSRFLTHARSRRLVLKNSAQVTRVISSSNQDNDGDSKKPNVAEIAKTGKLQDVVDTLLKTSGSQLVSSKTESSEQKKDNVETIVIVQPTLKNREARPKIDISKSYYDNIYIPTVRALKEYLLTGEDLDSLPRAKKRSPYPEKQDISVYLQKDVERIAVKKWGSLEKLQTERKKRDFIERSRNICMYWN